MGHPCDRITLYASQAEAVWQDIDQKGAAFSKRVYVAKKYGESAPSFLAAYDWFVRVLPRYVPKPEGAEYPYWAFADQYLMTAGTSSRILKLDVPLAEAVYFDMFDWNRVVRLEYMGKDKSDERRFKEELTARGITTMDVMLTPFYPDLKAEIEKSWQRLFRYDAAIRRGETPDGLGSLQAGLWTLRKEWVLSVSGAY